MIWNTIYSAILIYDFTQIQTGQKSASDIVMFVLSIVFGVVCFGFSIFVYGLVGYHTYILCINQTTNENLKQSWK